MNHDIVEKNIGLMGVLIALVISIGGLVEIVPLYFQGVSKQPAPGVEPYGALQLEGRDIYIREGCYNCHSQMVRPFRAETERYGHYSLAGESVYDHPFQFGSKRTGPDLARVGGRYCDEWHRVHLHQSARRRARVEHAGLPVARRNTVDGALVEKKMRALRKLGEPYTDEDIAGAAEAVEGKTELEALIAYLQGLGTNVKPGG